VEDSFLMEQLKNGAEAAFDQLFRAYYARLCRYACMLGCTAEDAEEIVQDLFARFWTQRNQTDITISIKSYLFTATRNAVFNLFEHRKVQQKYAGEVQYSQSELHDVNPLLVAELQERIQFAINSLSEGRRQVFQLSRNQGLSYQEIADKLNISVKTVENQMGHALKHLREELKDYLPIIIIMGINLFEVFK